MRALAPLLISLCLVPITGEAANVTVGCPGGAPATYPSIAAALNALRSSTDRNHTVTISGTCTESVNVSDFDNVELVSTTGATIISPGGPAVQVALSKNITLRDLVIQGASGFPVVRVSDSIVDIRGGTVEGGSNGVDASSQSRVNIYGTTIQDNTGTGVLVQGNSSVAIRTRMYQKALIQRNGNGVVVYGGSSLSIGSSPDPNDSGFYGVEVLDNVYYGVNTVGGYVAFEGNGQTRIANNANGLAASRGGTVNQFGGPVVIANNRQVGVASWLGGSILLMVATIDANGGDPNSTLPFAAGVEVAGNATALFGRVTISNSPVTGVLVRDNAFVTFSGGSIVTGNRADGIRVETLSGLRFQGAQTTITGNSGFDLVCDANTYAAGGSLADVGKQKCPGFSRK